ELSTITVSRHKANALICTDYNNARSFEGVRLNEKDANTFRLHNIIRLNGAILKNGGFESYGDNGNIHMEISNEGLPTTVTKIESITGDIQWSLKQLPLYLPGDQDFMLSGQGNVKVPYKVKITCTDSNGKEV